jgi:signal transduction histidine kinase
MPVLGSIKRRLIALHLVAVLVVAIVLPLALYWRVDTTATDLHQRALRDQAAQIAPYLRSAADGRMTLDLPTGLRELYSVSYGRYGYAVLARDGQVLLGSRPNSETLFPEDPRRGSPSFFQRPLGQSQMFGASVPYRFGNDTVWVQVWEDQEHRDVLIDDIVAEFLPHVAWVILPVLAVLLGIDLAIVGRTLRPLDEASRRAEQIGPTQTDIRLPETRMPRDVLPLVRAINEALERLERGFIMQRDFVADAAHELRTPLAILRAQVEAIADQDPRHALLADIDGMTRIVNQLIEVAESDALTIRPGEVADLRAVATEVVAFMAPVAIIAGKDIAISEETEAVWVEGNGAALFQAIRNLVENAIIHTPPGTAVEVTVTPEGGVTVRDAGTGIPREQRDLIFQRFWRGDRSRAGGTGLGLAIVARVVRAHGGHIAVADAHPRGAAFTIRLRSAVPAPVA